MAEDLTDLVNKLTARIGARLPKHAGVTAEKLVFAILGTVTLELAKRDSRAKRMERERDQTNAAVARVRSSLAKWDGLGRWKEWSDVHEFVEDVRTALDQRCSTPQRCAAGLHNETAQRPPDPTMLCPMGANAADPPISCGMCGQTTMQPLDQGTSQQGDPS